jgi:hypothetical protein
VDQRIGNVVIDLEEDIMNQNVITALEEQVGCYRRLARLAQVQHEHVRQSQIEQLLHVLHSRQQVLNQLTELETVIAPAKRRWSEFVDEIGEQRNHAEDLLAETRRLLEEITTSDREDAMVLQQRKLNLGKQINQASAAKRINRNYAAAAYGKRASTMDVSQ